MKKIVVPLSLNGVRTLEQELERFRREQEGKARELARRLAELGVQTAKIRFAAADYAGKKDAVVTAEETENGFVVKADGNAVLFLEFGTGLHGYGHNEARQFSMGPGTWSDGPNGKGHWNDPKGWWLPKSAGGGHTHGNAPAMAMYEARREILRRIEEIAREVFA